MAALFLLAVACRREPGAGEVEGTTEEGTGETDDGDPGPCPSWEVVVVPEFNDTPRYLVSLTDGGMVAVWDVDVYETGGFRTAKFGADGERQWEVGIGGVPLALRDGGVVLLYGFALHFYTAAGELVSELPLSAEGVPYALTEAADGSIVVAGFLGEDPMQRAWAGRVREDGVIETIFTGSLGEFAGGRARDIATGPDGELVMLGAEPTGIESNPLDTVVWKLTPDGTLVWMYAIPWHAPRIDEVAVHIDGTIVVAGGAMMLDGHELAFVEALEPDGVERWMWQQAALGEYGTEFVVGDVITWAPSALEPNLRQLDWDGQELWAKERPGATDLALGHDSTCIRIFSGEGGVLAQFSTEP